jgi:hypothetical protein
MQYFNQWTNLTDNRCLLWQNGALAASNSYCSGFPTNNGGVPFPLPTLATLISKG